MEFIPAIDLWNGQCVRLYQGDFKRQTAYTVSPDELLQRYKKAGARWIHIVDLEGAQSGQRKHHALIADLAVNTGLQLQVGGGIRSAAAIEALLSVGVSRVVVGSAALEEPMEVQWWLQSFGAERICLAFDVRTSPTDHPRVYTRGWARANSVSLWEALEPYRGQIHHVLCTDIARDGTLGGPNLELYRSACTRCPELQWQASGGVRRAEDLSTLKETGVAAAISGRALLEDLIPTKDWTACSPDASSPVLTFATARS
jgi:phosphoribosylformimino-5-aminoimidazole carboxamide ribotide isomerase